MSSRNDPEEEGRRVAALREYLLLVESRPGAPFPDFEQLTWLNAALENAPEPMVLLTIDAQHFFAITYVNLAFTEVFEYAADEIIGQPTSAMFGARTEAAKIARLRAGATTGEPVSENVTLYTKSGAPRLIEIRDRTLDARHRIVSFRDLTPLQMANDALMHTNQRLESLLANNSDAVLTIGVSGACLDANPAALSLFGYERNALVDSGYLRLKADPIFPSGERFPTALTQQQTMVFSTTFTRSDGRIISGDCKAVPMIVQHATDGAYLIVKDITRTSELGARLERDAKRLRALYEISAVGKATNTEQIDAALALVLDALDMEYGYLGKIDEQSIELEHVAGESFLPIVSRIDLKKTYVMDTLAHGDVLAIADLARAAEIGHDAR